VRGGFRSVKNTNFPAKFPVCREFAGRHVRSALLSWFQMAPLLEAATKLAWRDEDSEEAAN
jgi:hypothetical protein